MKLKENAIPPNDCLFYEEESKTKSVCTYYRYECVDYWKTQPICTRDPRGCWACANHFSKKRAYEIIKEYQISSFGDDDDDCMGAP